ncbi:MAG: alpha/beta hydrolase [Proteobacteria bacterium]|nr:alpha/beta hydrolase [Pseudomonadota bacterium]
MTPWEAGQPNWVPKIPGARSEVTQVAGVRTHVVRAGSGQPIILLHGLGGSSYSWRFLVPELAPHFEVFAPDLPGFGRSEKPADFDYSLRGMHAWLLEFMATHEIERACVVANSFGTLVSLYAAMETPRRITRMALLAAPAFPESRPIFVSTFSAPLFGPVCEWLLGVVPIRWIVKTVYGNHEQITGDVLAEYGAPLRTASGRHAVAQVLRNVVPPDWRTRVERYAALRQPTIVFGGEKDPLIPPRCAERLARTVANGRWVAVPGAGHVPHEDRPDLVNPQLVDFLLDSRAEDPAPRESSASPANRI